MIRLIGGESDPSGISNLLSSIPMESEAMKNFGGVIPATRSSRVSSGYFLYIGNRVEIGLTLYGRRKKWRVEYVIWEGTSHDMKEGKLGLWEGLKIRKMMYQQILGTWSREWWKNRR
jgi:hypothetical protein